MYLDNIRKLIPFTDLEKCSSILCIQPHQDDNEVSAGGTIAKLAGNGCKITSLTITDGRCGSVYPTQDQNELIHQRKLEADRSAEQLGISKSIYLNYPDFGNHDERKLLKAILEVIQETNPEFIMTVDPFLAYEVHSDHLITGMAASKACYFSSYPLVLKEMGIEPEKFRPVKGIAYYNTSAPNIYINVDNTWDIKLKAIACHSSQFDDKTRDLVYNYLSLRGQYYGKKIKCNYAESFKVLMATHLHAFPEACFI